MKVVFIRPSNPTGSGYLRSFGFLPVPLGLLQLAGDVKEAGDHEVKIIDMEADQMNVPRVINETLRFNPDIVGLALHATAAHNVSVSIAKGIKEMKPDVVTLAGGHHATFVPEEMLRNHFDVVVMGEGDETMMELVNIVENHDDLAKVKGIVYRDKDGTIKRTPPRPLMRDLDKLPMPAFDLVNREKYTFDVFGKNETVACMETSRGCPYACEFCSVTPTWGNSWRNKSNERILKELSEIKRLGYSWVFFTDDIFIVQPNIKDRMTLFNQIIENGLSANFIAQMRVDITARNPEVIKKASDAGLRIAFLGVESGDDETLKKLHKGTVTSLAEKAVKVLHENGVIVLIGLILGAPYDTFKKMMKTIRFAYRLSDLGADSVQFSIYTPLPGTRVFVKALKEKRLFTLNWDYYDVLLPVMKTKSNPLLVQFLQYYGNYTFYLRKWIRGKFVRSKVPERKLELLRRAERYFAGKLGHYVKEIVVSLPAGLIKTARLMRQGTLPSEEKLQELISSSKVIVYSETEEKRNRYFSIDD